MRGSKYSLGMFCENLIKISWYFPPSPKWFYVKKTCKKTIFGLKGEKMVGGQSETMKRREQSLGMHRGYELDVLLNLRVKPFHSRIQWKFRVHC